MIVSVVLRFTQEQWDSVGEDVLDGVFCGVRADYMEANKLALELRRNDSRNIYFVRRIRLK